MRAALQVAVVAVVLAWGVLTSGFARWHCGRCADQRTTFDLFGYPVWTIEPHYDEYGIVEKWVRAHGRPCENIWLRGPFDPAKPDARFWPALNFSAAVNTPVDVLARRIRDAELKDVRQRDALGRTILHWVAVHKDVERRGALIALLAERGVYYEALSPPETSPVEWAYRSDPAAFVRYQMFDLPTANSCVETSSGIEVRLRSRVHEVSFGLDDQERSQWIKGALRDWLVDWSDLAKLELREAPNGSFLLVVWAHDLNKATASPETVGWLDAPCAARIKKR